MKQPSICWSNIFDNTFNMGPDTCEIPKEKIYDYKINTLKSYNIINQHNTTNVEYDKILK